MKKKINLSAEEQESIASAVKKAELVTSGEISTALISESSDYAFFELLASVFAGFIAFSIFLVFYGPLSVFIQSLFWNSPEWAVSLVIGTLSFIIGGIFYFLSNLPLMDRLIVPSRIMKKKVRARALQHFTESGVYATQDGTGILIFISLLERRVELLADKGISEKINPEYWNTVVNDLNQSIRKGELVDGLKIAIESCGNSLHEHFPRANDDKNELSDSIVLLEE